ncbi:MAG: hypothetical protein ACRCYU_24275 [Nocardioides sp.]
MVKKHVRPATGTPRRGETRLTRKRTSTATRPTSAKQLMESVYPFLPPTHTKTGRSWRRSASQQHQAQAAPSYVSPAGGTQAYSLPMFGTAPAAPLVVSPSGELVPMQFPSQAVEKKKRGEGALGKVGALTWRYRWQLAPVYATAVTLGASRISTPGTLSALAVAGLVAWAAETRAPDKIGGRVWLSRPERRLVRSWMTRAVIWAAGSAVVVPLLHRLAAVMPDPGTAHAWVTTVGVLALGAAVARPTWLWWRSRSWNREATEQEPEKSQKARDLVARWPLDVAAFGPDALRGSYITHIEDRDHGVVVAVITLGMHSAKAVNAETQNWLEHKLRMPVGTLRLEAVRERSTDVRLTLAPERALEKAPVSWEPVTLSEDGDFPLAVDEAGVDVRIHTFSASGVEHLLLLGVTDTGKSFTLVACILPGVLDRREVVWYADGGGGSSSSHVAAACDWWAPETKDWKAVIAAGTRLLNHRKAYRAAMGVSSWRGLAERVPMVTIVLEEATTINGQLTDSEQEQILTFVREGRKLGIRVVMSTQDGLAELLPGGRPARDQIAGGGAVIGHRMGGSQATRLASDSTPGDIDLRAMPAEPGFCAILRRGQIRTPRARVKYATPEKVAAHMAGVVVREIDDPQELAVLGKAYAGRITGAQAAAIMEDRRTADAEGRPVELGWDRHRTTKPGTAGENATDHSPVGQATSEPSHTPASGSVASITAANARREAADTQAKHAAILAVLRSAPAGLTRAAIAEKTGYRPETVKRYTKDLRQQGTLDVAETPEGHLWRLAVDQEAA